MQAVSATSGHLGTNLGAVELTLALHRVFSSPRDMPHLGHRPPGLRPQDRDRPAGDVHHPAPGGRACRATRPGPSPCTTGWRTATPRRSSATPTAWPPRSARSTNPDRQVVAVVGDGAMTGGMAFEGLNNLGHSGSRVVVVLNDNGRSYAPTVSRLSESLTRMRLHPGVSSVRRRIEAVRDLPGVGNLAYSSLQGLYSAVEKSSSRRRSSRPWACATWAPSTATTSPAWSRRCARPPEYDGPIVVHVHDPKGAGLRAGGRRRRKMPARRRCF